MEGAELLMETVMSGRTAPLLTIGIPTYNRADSYLRETLESVRAQTYADIEIIVSDNGSTDGTGPYVNGLGDPRIRYFRQDPPLKPNENFNFCLNRAAGSYLLLLHDDDTIDADFVETCLLAVQYSPDYSLIRTGTRLMDSRSRVIREAPNAVTEDTPSGLFNAWFQYRTGFYFCCTLFNAGLLRSSGGFHSKNNLVQDCAAVLDLAVKGRRRDVREVKASFRVHGNYLQYGLKLKLWIEDFQWLLDRICKRIPEESTALRDTGERFFAALSYKRAGFIAPRWNRWLAYLYVMRCFGFKFMPPPLMKALPGSSGR